MAQGSQELADDFLLQVGACITQWADVEEELFEICLACLGCPRERAAIVYYRTPTIDTRLKLVDELIEAVFPKPDRPSGGHVHPDIKRWRRIRTSFETALRTRSRIAHQPMATRSELRNIGLLLLGWYQESWFEIYVSRNEQYRKKAANTPALRINDLKAHYRVVLSLKDGLRSFRADVLIAHIGSSPQPSSPLAQG